MEKVNNQGSTSCFIFSIARPSLSWLSLGVPVVVCTRPSPSSRCWGCGLQCVVFVVLSISIALSECKFSICPSLQIMKTWTRLRLICCLWSIRPVRETTQLWILKVIIAAPFLQKRNLNKFIACLKSRSHVQARKAGDVLSSQPLLILFHNLLHHVLKYPAQFH